MCIAHTHKHTHRHTQSGTHTDNNNNKKNQLHLNHNSLCCQSQNRLPFLRLIQLRCAAAALLAAHRILQKNSSCNNNNNGNQIDKLFIKFAPLFWRLWSINLFVLSKAQTTKKNPHRNFAMSRTKPTLNSNNNNNSGIVIIFGGLTEDLQHSLDPKN